MAPWEQGEMDQLGEVGSKRIMLRPRYARLSGEAMHPAGARPSKCTIIMRREAAQGFKGFLCNKELAERHPQNARTPAQGIQGFQRHGGECEFIRDSGDEVPGVGF
jgi:hypothetical protein